MKHLTITRTKSGHVITCDDCGGEPRAWTLERARQHADRQRHTVRVVVEHTTIYQPTESS